MGYLRLLLEKLQNSVGKGGEKKGYEKNFDPDDPETIDMLCNLPAEKVWKIRKVSKGLCDLIQSPDFANTFLERAPSIAFLQRWQSMKFFYLDEDDNKRVLVNGSVPLLKKKKIPILVGSCNGLLLFESPPNFETKYNYYSYYIWNPVTQQVVNFTCPALDSQSGRIYGLYYHSSTQEYRLLYLRMNTNDGLFVRDYGIIKAGQNAGRRLYLQGQQRIPCPKAQPPAVVVKNFLYWMADSDNSYYKRPCQHSIIGFDTDAEELFTLPHPDDNICQPSTPHCPRIKYQMRLLEMDGRLTCWCLGVASAHVWVLNDESNNWSLRCHLNFDHDLFFKWLNHDIKLVSFLNNEVLLVWYDRVFRYNLSTRKVRNLKGFKHGFYLILVAHTKSVVILEDQRVGQPIYFESKEEDKSRWVDQVKQN
ncbi:hypothetical protein CCACVL1_04825 [Corchorus capsularis]|uniref:F-box associated beta-propeller type 3 domain-containing protein n=1 Tax=Corchorus capsularis TaxID=210143 RepID=A0A1R3JP71_COCAP|nr:hypothetical protein CCACVL1_04825 [Corchorus capsularis]